MDTTKDQLRAIVARALQLQIDPSDLPDDKLVATLGIDSIGMLEIIVRVENVFRITVEDADMSPDLIDSLDTLAVYITNKKKNGEQHGPQH